MHNPVNSLDTRVNSVLLFLSELVLKISMVKLLECSFFCTTYVCIYLSTHCQLVFLLKHKISG